MSKEVSNEELSEKELGTPVTEETGEGQDRGPDVHGSSEGVRPDVVHQFDSASDEDATDGPSQAHSDCTSKAPQQLLHHYPPWLVLGMPVERLCHTKSCEQMPAERSDDRVTEMRRGWRVDVRAIHASFPRKRGGLPRIALLQLRCGVGLHGAGDA